MRNVRPHRSRWYGEEGPRFDWGKLDGALAAGGSATVSIWRGDPLADTGENVTAHAPPLLTAGSIASGNWVRVTWYPHSSKWYVDATEC